MTDSNIENIALSIQTSVWKELTGKHKIPVETADQIAAETFYLILRELTVAADDRSDTPADRTPSDT